MRYLPLTEADRRSMLGRIGVPSVESLYRDVPEFARLTAPVDLPAHLGELEVEREIASLAAKNLGSSAVPSFLGAGAYRHHVPASVDHLIQRGEFLTSYTPYQPEITQGTLQYLFEFQTQVCLITGMEVANASMYDGATATAEAVMMANRVTRRRRAVVSGNLHPHYREVIADPCPLPWLRDGGRRSRVRHGRGSDPADRRRDLLRRGPESRFLRPSARPQRRWPRPAARRARC